MGKASSIEFAPDLFACSPSTAVDIDGMLVRAVALLLAPRIAVGYIFVTLGIEVIFLTTNLLGVGVGE